MATLDGQYVFGQAVQVAHQPYQSAHQETAYQGLNGRTSVFMGSRGRTFKIKGVFQEATADDCIAAEAVMRSYADGIGRTLVDDFGRVWYPVIFKGEITNGERGPMPASDGTWCWSYELVMEGLA